MTKRDVSHYLADILDTIGDLEALIGNKSLAAYSKDVRTKRATERCVEIISEAARHLPASLTKQHPEIPWKQIRGVGNVLRHEYNKIVDEVMWTAAKDYIKPLKKAVIAMQGEEKAPAPVRRKARAEGSKRARRGLHDGGRYCGVRRFTVRRISMSLCLGWLSATSSASPTSVESSIASRPRVAAGRCGAGIRGAAGRLCVCCHRRRDDP